MMTSMSALLWSRTRCVPRRGLCRGLGRVAIPVMARPGLMAMNMMIVTLMILARRKIRFYAPLHTVRSLSYRPTSQIHWIHMA